MKMHLSKPKNLRLHILLRLNRCLQKQVTIHSAESSIGGATIVRMDLLMESIQKTMKPQMIIRMQKSVSSGDRVDCKE